MSRFPAYVDVEFSARCNLACGFCFGPADDRSKLDLPIEFWEGVLDVLATCGVRGIVVSGGEPTLYPHLEHLLHRAKSLGLATVVSTHGRYAARVLKIAPLCDWIALPVDALETPAILDLRGDGWGLDCAAALALKIRKASASTKIKLGTVATRRNTSDVLGLAARLKDFGSTLPFDTWKIYEYTPRRKFRERRKEYELGVGRFDTLRNGVLATGIGEVLNTVFSSTQSRTAAYLFVYPDGTAAIPNHGKNFGDLVLGNLVAEGVKVLDRVEQFDLFNNVTNYRGTYA